MLASVSTMPLAFVNWVCSILLADQKWSSIAWASQRPLADCTFSHSSLNFIFILAFRFTFYFSVYCCFMFFCAFFLFCHAFRFLSLFAFSCSFFFLAFCFFSFIVFFCFLCHLVFRLLSLFAFLGFRFLSLLGICRFAHLSASSKDMLQMQTLQMVFVCFFQFTNWWLLVVHQVTSYQSDLKSLRKVNSAMTFRISNQSREAMNKSTTTWLTYVVLWQHR